MLLTISDLNGKQIVRMFHEKELNKKQTKKKNKKNFQQKKVIEGKGDKLHVKWKGYNNLFLWLH